MTRAALIIALGVPAIFAIALTLADALTAPRLHKTGSGDVIDRTNKTDQLKAPPIDLRVVSECRSA